MPTIPVPNRATSHDIVIGWFASWANYFPNLERLKYTDPSEQQWAWIAMTCQAQKALAMLFPRLRFFEMAWCNNSMQSEAWYIRRTGISTCVDLNMDSTALWFKLDSIRKPEPQHDDDNVEF